jgi:hypothetical protein
MFASRRASGVSNRQSHAGPQFTCFTGTKVQILTPEERQDVSCPVVMVHGSQVLWYFSTPLIGGFLVL